MSGELFAVTGAGGFVGRELVSALRRRGGAVRSLTRSAVSAESVAIGSIGSKTDWSGALTGVTHVIHCAGRAHIMQDKAVDSLAAFREVNVDGTRRLAEAAAAQGVRRLVFVSSIKVNGESTQSGVPFTERDHPAPEDAYGRSKWEAEQALMEVSARTGLEVVIVRPPLVYGPGVKGNFARLVRWIRAGIPLPFASVQNKRSLVSLPNLIDLLGRCAVHPRAAGQVFLAGDGEDLSTPDLIRRLAHLQRRPARLFPMPPSGLNAMGALLGRRAEVARLIGTLQVSINHACRTLDWKPVASVDVCLAETVSEIERRQPSGSS